MSNTATSNTAQVPAPPTATPSRSGRTVTVASKLPYTMILRLHQFDEVQEPVMGGGWRTVKQARPMGKAVVLNGNAHPVNQAPSQQVVGGYALTFGVPADFFDEWVRQNADHDAVLNNLIFAHEKHGHAEGQAKEQKGIRSGFEAIDPKNPGSRLRGIESGNKSENA